MRAMISERAPGILRRGRAWPSAAALLLAAMITAGCDRSAPPEVVPSGGGPAFTVVAAENFWGSIAVQLAGDRARVRSIIVDPETDPHSYQPSAADARSIAEANMVIVNGAGYDEWASQLLSASASSSRTELDVGRALHLASGANPHRWYYPADVQAVSALIAADYERIDPADGAYFASRERSFESVELARYDALRREIRTRFAGVPVGYSESIFQGLGEDLGLRLMTPYGFVKAVAEGIDVTAQDKRLVDEQASRRTIDLWVLNAQNVTPDVKRVTDLAAANGIPIVRVTETLDPAGDTFEAWQSAQLESLLAGLHKATGK
jgi:zinc/manganese transport system substrate-binding protein